MDPQGSPPPVPSPSPPGSRSQIFVWTLFDFAQTSFSVMIISVGYSLYFKNVVAGGSGRGDFFWGLIVSTSMLLTALVAPVLGAASDYAHSRKLYLLGFTMTCVTCTSLLFFVGPGMVITGALLFIVANIGFEGGIVFYDAFLPFLTTKEHYGRISGYGFAMGYIGSLTSLIIARPLYAGGFAPENLPHVRLSFVVAAAIFLVFSLPLFLLLHDRPGKTIKQTSYIRAGTNRVRDTLSHLKSYRQVTLFLVAFFVYNDGILTVISFASIFAQQSLNFSLEEILILFAVVQASAIIGSLIFGTLTDRIGPKRAIVMGLACWIGVVVGAYLVTSKMVFYAISIAAGACMGGSQSASRSLMAMLTPPDREAEFFGFYDGFCGKASAVIGTFVFGALSWATGSQRIAALSVGAFFVAGLTVLHFVQDPSGKTFRRHGEPPPLQG